MQKWLNLSVALLAVALAGCRNSNPSPAALSARATAAEAYIYGYPLVLMDVSRTKLTNVSHPNGKGQAPINQFGNVRTFPDATFTDVVSPNADTLYSSAWLDLWPKETVINGAWAPPPITKAS